MKWQELVPEVRSLRASLAAALIDLDAARAALKDAYKANEALQDRLNFAMSDRSKMWALLDSSIKEMAISYQMHVNVQWQKQGHGTPYPDAPHIPAAALPKVPDSDQQVFQRHELPSEMQARKTKEFMDEYARRFTEALK